jgi:hypothetical protein
MTSNDISIASSAFENSKNTYKCLNCVDIVGKFLSSLIVILILIIFSDKMFDIQGYIEDHGLEYQYIESFMIILLLITFYFVSKIVYGAFLYAYNHVSQQNKCKDNEVIELSISTLCSIIYIYLASNYVTYILSPPGSVQGGSVQQEMLWLTVFTWLLYLLLLNIILSSSLIEERIIHPISNITCGIFIYPPWNFIKGKLVATNSVRGKNDQ